MNEYGKIPPQAIDFERLVLGTILLTEKTYYQVCDILKPKIFYKEEHKEIYTAIENLINRSKPVDQLTVTSELRKTGMLESVGGGVYISELTNKVGGENIEYHSQILVEKYFLRELIRISALVQTDAFEETTDVFELQDNLLTELYKLQNFISKEYTKHTKQITLDVVREVERANSDTKDTGLKSSFNVFNDKFGSYQPKLYYLFAGRPGMGKSTFARNESLFFAQSGYPGIYFSLEMTENEIVKCNVSAMQSINYSKMLRGGMDKQDFEDFNSGIAEIEKIPLFVNEKNLSIKELYLEVKRFRLSHDIKWIVIDHLLRLKFKEGVRYVREEVNLASSMLKRMAKELEIPIIALVQLNREVEKRPDKVPQLSDLKESGNFEEDADFVCLLYRPEYYGITTANIEIDGMEQMKDFTGKGIFLVKKNRQGSIGDFELDFEGHYQRFKELKEPF